MPEFTRARPDTSPRNGLAPRRRWLGPLLAPVDALAVMHLNHRYGNAGYAFDRAGLLRWAVPQAKVAAGR